jgi:hypothetical protein
LQGLANRECDGDMQALAENINVFLQSVTKDFEPITAQDNFTTGRENRVPDKFIIQVDEVEKKLELINTKKAVDPDNIPSWVLKDCADILAPTLQQQPKAGFRSSPRLQQTRTSWSRTGQSGRPERSTDCNRLESGSLDMFRTTDCNRCESGRPERNADSNALSDV